LNSCCDDLYIAEYGKGAQQILEPPTFWQWWAGPALLYLIERVLRIVRGSQNTIILQAIQHPSRVIELRMKKTRFDYKVTKNSLIHFVIIISIEMSVFVAIFSLSLSFALNFSCHKTDFIFHTFSSQSINARVHTHSRVSMYS
jgi:hypothetical protein